MSATDTASMPAVPASDHAHVLEATPETLPADSRPLPDLPAGAWWPVAASIFAIAWGGNEFTPLLVMYREVSQFSDLVVDGLLGAYVLGIVPALMIGGPLSDVYGRRPVLLPAAPLSFLGSLLLMLGPGSPLMIGIGRILCGLALGLVMAIGTAWIKEISDASGASPAAGARRASLALTTGFLAGALVAAILAQWGPWPTRTSYALHMLITVVTGLWLLTAPETRKPGHLPAENEPVSGAETLMSKLIVPKAAHKRFLRVVLPVAPWVFGACGTAYAVLPALLKDRAGDYPIAFAGIMTAVTLGFGVGIQTVGKKIDTHRSARASVIAMAIVATGAVFAAGAASTTSLTIGLIAAATLGCGYGLALVAGLSEVQRLAGPDDLAGLTAVFYSIAYLGFFVPMLLAALSTIFSYTTMLIGGAVIAILTLIEVALAWQAHLPGAHE